MRRLNSGADNVLKGRFRWTGRLGLVVRGRKKIVENHLLVSPLEKKMEKTSLHVSPSKVIEEQRRMNMQTKCFSNGSKQTAGQST